MQWHDHPMAYKGFAKAMRVPNGSSAEMANEIWKRLRRQGDTVHVRNTGVQIDTEAHWIAAERPYYDLYPSVAEAFAKIDLDKVKCEQLKLPLPELLIRMPKGHELQLSARTKFRSVLVGEGPGGWNKEHRGWLISLNTGDTMEANDVHIPMHTVVGCLLVNGATIKEHLVKGRASQMLSDQIDNEAVENIYRIIATLCLLKNDPDLIEPEPLDSDREKWERTHDPALIVKAEKRGKKAWSVGKQIEVAPGFRRPHFAIRWCGKGRADPRVRPIKGCLVRKKAIQEVPTDWLGPEDAPLQSAPQTA